MFQKNFQRIIFLFSHLNHDFLKKFRIMDIYEKIIIISSFVVFVVVLFMPLMIVSSNEVFDQGAKYLFLITESSLWKSLILIEGPLLLSLLWLFHNKFKIFIVENLGFQGNNYLFLSFLFLISMTGFITMGEVVNLFSTYTMVINLTPLYYISLIILVLLMSLCVYMSFFHSSKYFKGHVVGYHGRKEVNNTSSEKGSLFDSIQHDD